MKLKNIIIFMLLFNAFFFLLISGSKAQTIYNYYIDDNLDVWVKVDLIPASGTKTIYVIKEAGYTPDGNAVFEFFDDFNDGVIDTNKWQVVFGSWTEQNGVLTITQTGGTDRPTIEALGITISDAIIEWRMRRTNNGGSDGNWMGIIARKQTSTTTYDGYLIYDQDGTTNVYNANIKVYSDVDGVLGAGANLFTDNVFRNWKAVLYGQNIDVFVYDDAGNQLNSLSVTSSAYASGKLALMIHLAVIGEYDWIRVRKYAQQEPTITITDMGSYYKVDITNNLAQDLVNYQVKLDGASLNIQSQTESLKVTDTPPATTLSIAISSPKNQTYLTNKIYLAFNVTSPSDTSFYVRAELDTTIVYENNNYVNGTNINISLQQYINDEKTYLVLVTAQDNQGVATKNISFSTNLYDLNVEKQNYYVERGIIRDYRKGLDFGDQYYKKVCGILNGGIIVFSQYNITKLNASNPNQILYSSSINYAPGTGKMVRSSCVIGSDGYIYLTGFDNNNNGILAKVQDTGSGFNVVASAQAGTSYAYGDLIFLNNYIYVIYQEYLNDYTAMVYKYTNTISLVSSVTIGNGYYNGRIFIDKERNELVVFFEGGNLLAVLSTSPTLLKSGVVPTAIYDMDMDNNYYYIAGAKVINNVAKGYLTRINKATLSYSQVQTDVNNQNYYPYIVFVENNTIMLLSDYRIIDYNASTLNLINSRQSANYLGYYYATKINNKAYFFYISRYFREISADPYIEFSNSQTQAKTIARCGNFNSQYATIEYYVNNSLFASTQIACDNSTQTITQNLNTSLEGDLLINVKLIDVVERRNSQLTTYHDITLPEISISPQDKHGFFTTNQSTSAILTANETSFILYCNAQTPSTNGSFDWLLKVDSTKTLTFYPSDKATKIYVSCKDGSQNEASQTKSIPTYVKKISLINSNDGSAFNLWNDYDLMKFATEYTTNTFDIKANAVSTIYYYDFPRNQSDTLIFERTLANQTQSIQTYFNLDLIEPEFSICVPPYQTLYEILLYSATQKPVALLNNKFNCYEIFDYTRFIRSNTYTVTAYTPKGLYYLYIYDAGKKVFLAVIDGSVAQSVNIDLIEYKNTPAFTLLNEDVSISKDPNSPTTLIIKYYDMAQDNTFVEVKIYDGNNIVFQTTETSNPNDVTIYFDYSTITLNNNILKIVITTDQSTITKYFDLNGNVGFLHPSFAIPLALLIFFLGATISLKQIFGPFGLLMAFLSLALLGMSVQTAMTIFFEAVILIIILFIIIIMRSEYEVRMV